MLPVGSASGSSPGSSILVLESILALVAACENGRAAPRGCIMVSDERVFIRPGGSRRVAFEACMRTRQLHVCTIPALGSPERARARADRRARYNFVVQPTCMHAIVKNKTITMHKSKFKLGHRYKETYGMNLTRPPKMLFKKQRFAAG